jgi:hypothetical protein
MMTDEEIATLVKERNEALFSLDRAKIERYARKYGLKLPSSDEVFWLAVHKAICNIPSAPRELKRKSKKYLREHGSSPSIKD